METVRSRSSVKPMSKANESSDEINKPKEPANDEITWKEILCS